MKVVGKFDIHSHARPSMRKSALATKKSIQWIKFDLGKHTPPLVSGTWRVVGVVACMPPPTVNRGFPLN